MSQQNFLDKTTSRLLKNEKFEHIPQ